MAWWLEGLEQFFEIFILRWQPALEFFWLNFCSSLLLIMRRRARSASEPSRATCCFWFVVSMFLQCKKGVFAWAWVSAISKHSLIVLWSMEIRFCLGSELFCATGCLNCAIRLSTWLMSVIINCRRVKFLAWHYVFVMFVRKSCVHSLFRCMLSVYCCRTSSLLLLFARFACFCINYVFACPNLYLPCCHYFNYKVRVRPSMHFTLWSPCSILLSFVWTDILSTLCPNRSVTRWVPLVHNACVSKRILSRIVPYFWQLHCTFRL